MFRYEDSYSNTTNSCLCICHFGPVMLTIWHRYLLFRICCCPYSSTNQWHEYLCICNLFPRHIGKQRRTDNCSHGDASYQTRDTDQILLLQHTNARILSSIRIMEIKSQFIGWWWNIPMSDNDILLYLICSTLWCYYINSLPRHWTYFVTLNMIVGPVRAYFWKRS